MNKYNSSLKINAFMNTLLSTLSTIFPLITYPYITRVLSPEGMGKVSFATSVMTYFVLFAQLGIPIYGIKVCAKVREDKIKLSRTVQELIIISVAIGFLAYIFLFLSLAFIPRFQTDRQLLLISSMSIIINAIGVEWLYKALEKYTYITIRSALINIISIVLMFMFVRDSEDYVVYAGITVFASAASYLFNFVNIYKYIIVKPVGNYCFTRHLRPIVIFFGLTSVSTININLGAVLLGFLSNDFEVGVFSPPLKIKYVLVNIVSSLGVVLLPRASYYFENELFKEFEEISKKAIDFVLVSAIPISVYFMLFAKETIIVLAGNDYYNSIYVLQVLIPILLIDGLLNVMGIQMLVPMNRERTVLFSIVVGIIVDFAFSVLLIPTKGAVGAAIGLLLSELVILLIQFRALKQLALKIYKGQKYSIIIIGVILGIFMSLWVKILPLNSLLSLIVSAIVFFGTYVVVLIWLREPVIVEIINTVFKLIKKRH